MLRESDTDAGRILANAGLDYEKLKRDLDQTNPDTGAENAQE